MCRELTSVLTLLALQSHFGGKLVNFQVVCSPNGTAVLKGRRRWLSEDFYDNANAKLIFFSSSKK